MYLIQLILTDEKIPTKGDFNRIVSVEDLQAFDIGYMTNEQSSVEPLSQVITAIPKKGGSVEIHCNYYESHKDVKNDDVIAMCFTSDCSTALRIADRLERADSYKGVISAVSSPEFDSSELPFVAFPVFLG